MRCAALALVLAGGACAPKDGAVIRLVEGRYVPGRYVTVRAYEAYARGAHLEARGDLDAAIAAYGVAADEDPGSPEIWSRVGALRCRRGQGDPEPAFARAERADPDYAPLWYERARCAAGRGESERAVGFARRAFRLDPDRADATWLLARLLEERGDAPDALRLLEAEATRSPDDRTTWQALGDLAARLGRPGAAARAAAALQRGERGLRPDRRDVDAALISGDLDAARRHALRARLPASDVAVRAAALGAGALARAQATLVLGADPDDTDARIALVAGADAEGDREAFRSALQGAADEPTRPGELAALLFAEVLLRHAGAKTSRAFLAGALEAAESDDDLTDRVRRRIVDAGVLDPTPPARDVPAAPPRQ